MRELKKHSHHVVYIIAKHDLDIREFPETVFHSYRDATYNLPPKEINSDQFPPVSGDIIDKFHCTESLVLSMMNRMFDEKCVDERKHIYYEMLRYWIGIIKKYRPEFIIFPDMPHYVYDFIIYELAHFFGISVLIFDDTRIGGRLLFFNDLWKGSERLREELEKNKGKKFSLEDLSEDIQKYCRPRMTEEYDKVPQYIVNQKKKYSLWKTWVSDPKVKACIKNLTVFYKAPRYVYKLLRDRPDVRKRLFRKFYHRFTYNLPKEYQKAQSQPDFNKNFVYFALHNQPERSTSPQGDMFVDQILAIEMLVASLPENWVVYVKEHPMQWIREGLNFSGSRYKGYYEKLARMKNVYLVPVETNSYDLIKNAKVIATVTGAVAWEAALQLKPSIIFGTVWYQDCPGIFKVGDVNSCRKALEIIKNGFRADRDKLINYLKCFDNATIRGFVSPFAGKESGMSFDESIQNITQQILKEIQNPKHNI